MSFLATRDIFLTQRQTAHSLIRSNTVPQRIPAEKSRHFDRLWWRLELGSHGQMRLEWLFSPN